MRGAHGRLGDDAQGSRAPAVTSGGARTGTTDRLSDLSLSFYLQGKVQYRKSRGYPTEYLFFPVRSLVAFLAHRPDTVSALVPQRAWFVWVSQVVFVKDQVGVSHATVSRWLRHGSFPEHKSPQRRTRLDPHLKAVAERWEAGCHNIAQLHRELVAAGHTLTYRNVYRQLGPCLRAMGWSKET